MPCYVKTQNGHTVIACTRGQRTKPRKCAYCGRPAPLLCDFPVGDGKTCDKPICLKCSVRVASNTDYCKAHNQTTAVKS